MEAILVEKQHCDSVGNALARAFMEDPINCYVLPDEQRRWKLLSWMFPRWVRTMSRHGVSYTTPDFAGGALWRSPDLGLWTWFWDQILAGMFLAPFKLYPGELYRLQKVHGEATRRMRKSLATPHWMLDVLGVLPERHGQGVARCLVSPVLARADAQSLPCYLITNKEKNIAIYNRFGFEVIEQGLLAGTDLMFYEMRRPAPANSTARKESSQ